MIAMRPLRLALSALLTSVVLVLSGGSAHAAPIVIDNADAAGQGLNDPTPFTPVGGNTATTLGAARLAVFNRAAALWGAELQSAVPIHVQTSMVPLACDATSAIVGSAGSTTVHRDFPGAPVAATWYPQALANAISGTDLDPTTPDIDAKFNSALGSSGCLTGSTFYLGFDANPAAMQFDMLTVVLHELGHGLGFASFVDFTTGAEASGLPDAFLLNTQEFGATPSALSAMTDQQRVAAAVSSPDLYWSGAAVQADSSRLSAGLISGHVRLYAPATLVPGSSVSHFSTSLTPDELMEPLYTGPNHNLALTAALLRDTGWSPPAAAPRSVPALPGGTSVLLALALAGAFLWRSANRRSALATRNG
jgi:hypothetical protein